VVIDLVAASSDDLAEISALIADAKLVIAAVKDKTLLSMPRKASSCFCAVSSCEL
jgi:hypothetical protein